VSCDQQPPGSAPCGTSITVRILRPLACAPPSKIRTPRLVPAPVRVTRSSHYVLPAPKRSNGSPAPCRLLVPSACPSQAHTPSPHSLCRTLARRLFAPANPSVSLCYTLGPRRTISTRGLGIATPACPLALLCAAQGSGGAASGIPSAAAACSACRRAACMATRPREESASVPGPTEPAPPSGTPIPSM